MTAITKYRATGNAGRTTRDTPRQAALAYFEQFPSSRKCEVQEGKSEDGVFTVTFSLTDKSTWPAHWDNVTKKGVAALPDIAEGSMKKNTYRLGSSSLVFAPGVVRAAICQYPHDRNWASRLITEGWSGVSAAAAEALLSKTVAFTIDGEDVVFTVEEGAAA